MSEFPPSVELQLLDPYPPFMSEFPPSVDYCECDHLIEPASPNQVLVNTECYRRAVQLTMHTNAGVPKYRYQTKDPGTPFGKKKGMYKFKYRKLGQASRSANEVVAQRYKEMRRRGVPHEEISEVDVPPAYCLASPVQVMLGNLCARVIRTVADQTPDF
jgi:hypothetical protein